MSSAATSPGGRTFRRRVVVGGLGVVLALAAVAVWVEVSRRSSVPPPAIPAPENLGLLDPQVRDHLARRVGQVAEAPWDGRRRSDLGLAFAVNGLWAEARQSFQDAVRLGDDGPLPRMYAAVALQESGDPAGAAEELKRVVERYPEAAPAWHRLGVARVATGDLTEAEAAFARVTALAPSAWQGWAGVGEARVRQGRHADAMEPLERAIALDPYARSAYHVLGQAYQAVGRSTEAATALAAGSSQTVGPMPDDWARQALDHMRLLPDQFERADALLAQGRIGEAIARLHEASRFHPTHVGVMTRLARALTAGDQADAAWTLLEAGLRASPEDPGLLTAASETAAALGRGDEALGLARRARAVAPQLPEVHVAEANACLALDDDRGAVAALEQALERAPTDVGLLVQLGDLEWHNLKRPDTAWTRYMRAYQADPIHPATLERLVRLAVERGDFEWAERQVLELRRLRLDRGILGELEAILRKAKGGG